MNTKKILSYFVIIGVILTTIVLMFDVYPLTQEDVLHETETEGYVRDTELGVTFQYPKSPDGYVLEAIPETHSANENFIRGYHLTLERDYIEMQNTTEPREGPPAITVLAYKNPEKLLPAVWTVKYPLESNVELIIGEQTETEVSGAKAVQYIADGLYISNNYVIAHGDYVFVFTGTYIDETSPTKTDFETIINSITFTP